MREPFGFKLNLREDQKLTRISVSEDLKEYFTNQKQPSDYLKEFIISEKDYENIINTLDKNMEDSLPKDIKVDCNYCNGDSEDISDKKCDSYLLQMSLTYSVAAKEFINIVFHQRHIYNNKKYLADLTKRFFECLSFVKGEGLLLFDLDKLIRYTLNTGFLTISQMLSNSDTLKNLRAINKTLDKIKQEELSLKTYKKQDDEYLGLQKEFYENKQHFYKEELHIEKESKCLPQGANLNRPNRTDLAFFIYYTSETNYRVLDAPFPSDAAWREMHEKYNKNGKNIQKMYNEILDSKKRLVKTKTTNIKYVMENMLNGYPKAKNLANDELKTVKLNS